MSTMRKYLLKIGFGILALTVVNSQAAVPFTFEYNLSREIAPGGFASAFYFSPGGKLSETWNFNSETLFSVPHSSRTAELIYSRINFKNTGVANFGGWNLNINYRYMAPLTALQSSANNVGTIYVRPELSNKFEQLELLIRNTLSLNIAEKWKKVTSETKPQESNSHFGYTFEFIPSYTLNDQVSLSALFLLNLSFFPADFGQSNSGTVRRVILDPIEIGYTHPSLGGWGLAFTVENDSRSGRGSGKPFLNKNNWSYIFKASKVF